MRTPYRALLCCLLLLPTTGCGAFRSFVGRPSPRSPSARLEGYFEEVFLTRLDRSPQMRSRLGQPGPHDRFDDLSNEHAREDHELLRNDLARLRAQFPVDRVGTDDRVSIEVFEAEARIDLEGYEWRLHEYPVNQMHGVHSGTAAFLINVHKIRTRRDAEDYIARLAAIRPRFETLVAGLREREALGVLPPAFVFPRVIEDCENLLRGAPFEATSQPSPLLADFEKKLAGAERLSDSARAGLVERARRTLLTEVQPAYEQLILLLQEQSERATDDAGVWKLPDGADYYAYCLRRATTTDLGAADIHALGLSEVERIHGEMREIQRAVGFEGSLNDFFEHLRTDARFTYPDDNSGRTAYLERAREILGAMRNRLPDVFRTLPESELVVKPVEPYRERSAGKAFYSAGAPDGSRPGVYYANLFDMRDMPIYQMEALAYHEGIPGHHMQVSIAQELEHLPRFRRFGGFTAYSEGWALYCEKLPKELGFYQDPYSDFGRLAMELWRACRLVVDTGIHSLRWTREEAIDYLTRNTPNPEGDCVKAIERYIVMPGQATAYTVGMLRILELRERARDELGDAFDLREFHDLILTSGPVPLSVLGRIVDEWVAGRLEAS